MAIRYLEEIRVTFFKQKWKRNNVNIIEGFCDFVCEWIRHMEWRRERFCYPRRTLSLLTFSAKTLKKKKTPKNWFPEPQERKKYFPAKRRERGINMLPRAYRLHPLATPLVICSFLNCGTMNNIFSQSARNGTSGKLKEKTFNETLRYIKWIIFNLMSAYHTLTMNKGKQFF